MSRLTSLLVLGKRRHYSGFDYLEGRRRELSGAEWQVLAGGCRVEDNGDCLACYRRAGLQFEIYSKSTETEAAEREADLYGHRSDEVSP